MLNYSVFCGTLVSDRPKGAKNQVQGSCRQAKPRDLRNVFPSNYGHLRYLEKVLIQPVGEKKGGEFTHGNLGEPEMQPPFFCAKLKTARYCKLLQVPSLL